MFALHVQKILCHWFLGQCALNTFEIAFLKVCYIKLSELIEVNSWFWNGK